jgi:UDP:flavonoid glycosyltransferase YjiC (YdhE family)
VCPLFADQSANGQLIEHAGAGVVLNADPAAGGVRSLGPADVVALRAAITTALRRRAYRRAAARVAREIADTPTLKQTLAQLLAGNQTA